MTCNHPKFEIPTDPHGKRRYESAMRHVEAAKKAGKSSEDIHAIFKKVMEFNPLDIESIPTDEAHATYCSAMIHMKVALDKGMSAEKAHAIAKKILSGETSAHCSHKD